MRFMQLYPCIYYYVSSFCSECLAEVCKRLKSLWKEAERLLIDIAGMQVLLQILYLFINKYNQICSE